MVSTKAKLTNDLGFGMRPASAFATAMSRFNSSVIIKYNGSDYNAKSLLNIISACIQRGDEIEIVAKGPDENEALAEAIRLIENGLG